MKILIGGDFCITPNYLQDNLIGDDVIALFKKSDLSIINLECPITIDDSKNKIIKTGPHLRSDERIFDFLKKIHIDVVSLANNHILDYGAPGLKHTFDFCLKNEIKFVGAGMSYKEASEPLFIEKENLKIALINFCESEWSIAGNNTPGANPLDLIENFNQIKSAKKNADFVIVIIHGGHEYYDLPSPRMVKQYRFYAENGADAIIGHHTHSIGGYEFRNDVPIIYSLGNFLFTMENQNKKWYNGLIAELEIELNKKIKLNLIPVSQTMSSFNIFLPENKEKNAILEAVREANEVISNPVLLDEEWRKFKNKNHKMIHLLSPSNSLPGRYLRAAINRMGINELILNRKYLKTILNHFRCEAHRDILTQLIV
jgi:poly-gamma-glutamate synthesis protein (capsule biosynthesis protein)